MQLRQWKVRPRYPPTGSNQLGRVGGAVIVVTFNSERDIGGLLEWPIAAVTGLIMQLVVNSGSTEATVQVARSHPDAVSVESGVNLRCAVGIKAGGERG